MYNVVYWNLSDLETLDTCSRLTLSTIFEDGSFKGHHFGSVKQP